MDSSSGERPSEGRSRPVSDGPARIEFASKSITQLSVRVVVVTAVLITISIRLAIVILTVLLTLVTLVAHIPI